MTLNQKDGNRIRLKEKAKEKESPTKVKTENRPFNENVTKLYSSRRPISLAKYNDLKKLCEDGIIPKIYHKEYLKLSYDCVS